MFRAGTTWGHLDRLKREKVTPKEQIQTDEIQDFNKTPIFMGGDVKALYPSMDQTATSELAFEAVLESGIEYTGIDYELLLIYLKLVIGDVE